MVEIGEIKSIIPARPSAIRFVRFDRLEAWVRRHWRVVCWHLLAWLLHFTVNNLLIFFADYRLITPQRTFFTYSLASLLFYTNAYWVVNRHVVKRQYTKLVGYTLLVLVGFVGLRYLLFYVYFPFIGYANEYTRFNTMFAKFLPDSIWIALQYLLFSYGYWFAIHTIALERQKRHMQNDLLLLEKAKSQSELAFLRSQLNPHFMFNTLNFFYAEALSTSSRLADGILELATMMRTVTELSNKSMVTVEHELAYIRNYISLQQMRFGEQMHLSLEVTGDEYEQDLMIPPLVLISLIENIFKYAELSDPDHAARIHIVLEYNSIAYHSYNLKKAYPAYSQGGIGMKNIEKQLTILYGDNYACIITDNASDYAVDMSIRLDEH